MVDSGIKKIFEWFLSNYPDCDLRISDAPNGFSIHIRQKAIDREYYGRKDFLFGQDYADVDDVPTIIRAAVPDIIEEIENSKRGILEQ